MYSNRIFLIISILWSIIILTPAAYGKTVPSIKSIGCLEETVADRAKNEGGDRKYRKANFEGKQDARVCQIGDIVEVKFETGSLAAWRSEDPKFEVSNLALAVNGHKIAGSNLMHKRGSAGDAIASETLVFQLVRDPGNAENLKAWKKILPKTKLWDSQSKVISVVDSTRKEFGFATIGIRVAPPAYIFWVGLLAFLIVAGLLVLAWRSDILKEFGPVPAGSTRPYSLAITQMAFWFVLVFGGFMYLSLVLGSVDVISNSALALIGVSATTGVFAVAVGGGKRTEEASKRQKLLDERQRLEKDNAELLAKSAPPEADPAMFASTNPKYAENARLQQNIDSDLRSTTVDPSIKAASGTNAFFRDLVYSDGSPSLPRFQMIAWTLAIGLNYIYSVFSTLQMPEYSIAVLGLLGVSSGTYVGFKFPSKDGK